MCKVRFLFFVGGGFGWLVGKTEMELSAAVAPILRAQDPAILPVIISDPRDVFVTKQHSASLLCTAAHADQIHFKCNSEFIKPNKHKNRVRVDAATKIRYVDSEVIISKEQVSELC